jgi:hypothetical protein
MDSQPSTSQPKQENKMSKLRDALRRKFKTPADAMKALGLDESLLAYDLKEDTESSKGAAMTGDEEVSPRDKFDKWLAYVASKLSDSDWLEYKQLLCASVEEEDDDTANDEPNPFPGRPRPGGSIDPLKASDRAIARRRAPPAHIREWSEVLQRDVPPCGHHRLWWWHPNSCDRVTHVQAQAR